MTKSPIITLLTDFGLMDPYVAEMKAVILSICPEARIVDITHLVRKFDIRMGAFILAQATPYFPAGTIHVVVVDPGVGTERKPIIIEAKRSLYVGPDNGVLVLSAMREGILHIYEISNPRYMLPNVSRTFHGRDIFSCAAAYLAKGIPPEEFGSEISEIITPEFARAKIIGDEVVGEIIHIDSFGNLISNISTEELGRINIKDGDMIKVKIRNCIMDLRVCSAYDEVPIGSPLTIIGSSNFLELSINQGNAAKTLGLKVGDTLRIRALKHT